MAAQENNIICILYGCSFPVVLRKQEVKGEYLCELFGECYVHGMMDGEAIEQGKDTKETEEFEIRRNGIISRVACNAGVKWKRVGRLNTEGIKQQHDKCLKDPRMQNRLKSVVTEYLQQS